MQPFRVRLFYQGKTWLSNLDLELGHDEIGCTGDPAMVVADDLVKLFAELGLPEPEPMPVIAVHHQVAQKLHAVTSPDSQRAHDMVDLQLLVTDDLDLAQAKATTERLFRFRDQHSWPPRVELGPRWSTIYADAAQDVDVLTDVNAAVAWVNDLLDRIDTAQ
ncbi:MAG: hypothetical protein JWN95_45 [Frankiales bacterium]|nr:hypothetical protein [Frankiales bacterium]